MTYGEKDLKITVEIVNHGKERYIASLDNNVASMNLQKYLYTCETKI
jgi:hypothetical protein